MTNLEFYKDEIKRIAKDDCIECAACIIKRGLAKCDKNCNGEYSINNLIDWLCEEHKEPIKLKQWEKELLKIHYNYADNSRYFSNWNVLHKMKINGHFKGVSDTSMTPEKILENCEVVDGD